MNTNKDIQALSDEQIQSHATTWFNDPNRDVCSDRQEAFALGMHAARAILATHQPAPAVSQQGGEIERGLAEKDAELYGTGFLVDGLRVAPEFVTIIRAAHPPADAAPEPREQPATAAHKKVRAYLNQGAAPADQHSTFGKMQLNERVVAQAIEEGKEGVAADACELPELPKPWSVMHRVHNGKVVEQDGFTAHQMRGYAVDYSIKIGRAIAVMAAQMGEKGSTQ